MEKKLSYWWMVIVKRAKEGDESARTDLRLENHDRRERGMPTIEDELLSELSTDYFVEVVIRQKSYPEVTLWATVLKREWREATTMEQIFELIEKKAFGQSYEERIEEMNKLSIKPIESLCNELGELRIKQREVWEEIIKNDYLLIEGDPLEIKNWNLTKNIERVRQEIKEISQAGLAVECLRNRLGKLIHRLEGLDDEGNLKITERPARKGWEQMRIDQINTAEDMLLHPEKGW